MSDSKKYYYMRLKDNFFDSEELKAIEAMKDGHKFSNILLKMYLRSLKRDGKLMLSDTIPYDSKILAKVVGHTEKNVKKAIELFVEYGLVEVLDSGAMYMLNIQEYIGNSSSEGDRQRKYRKKISTEKERNKCYNKCHIVPTPEIEIEKEIYKKRESEDDLIPIYNEFSSIISGIYPAEKCDTAAAFENWKKAIAKIEGYDAEAQMRITGTAIHLYLKRYKETNTKDGIVDYTYLCYLSSLLGDKHTSHIAPLINKAIEIWKRRDANNDLQTIPED